MDKGPKCITYIPKETMLSDIDKWCECVFLFLVYFFVCYLIRTEIEFNVIYTDIHVNPVKRAGSEVFISQKL